MLCSIYTRSQNYYSEHNMVMELLNYLSCTMMILGWDTASDKSMYIYTAEGEILNIIGKHKGKSI